METELPKPSISTKVTTIQTPWDRCTSRNWSRQLNQRKRWKQSYRSLRSRQTTRPEQRYWLGRQRNAGAKHYTKQLTNT
ncbi:hypothetical protein BHE74_00017576 [Ensete ventricosum]|nr:hypothetical protein GW17_00013405 [Ensete ventricosum]RWW74478.1 hypothetical protein BHE74_00017576 [Ensete ventricosum]RZR79722.1 hypothetical protein BHM03_00005522 [Ensete ventricosum]